MARRTSARGQEIPAPECPMTGITFDTGALIALERNRQRIVQVRQAALRAGLRVTVPAAVLAEWWRGRSDLREDIVASVRVEPLTDATARLAGEAIAHVRACAWGVTTDVRGARPHFSSSNVAESAGAAAFSRE